MHENITDKLLEIELELSKLNDQYLEISKEIDMLNDMLKKATSQSEKGSIWKERNKAYSKRSFYNKKLNNLIAEIKTKGE